MEINKYFFIGKGGVGKSTVSSLFATELARNKRKTLLVSMDPAHNQCDIFMQCFSQKPTKIDEYLDIIEIDEKYWIKKYLEKTEDDIRHNYSYQTAFNLGHYFNVLQYSPGIEEYALILGYENIMEKYRNYEYYIFDMPPTALTLKFFMLPSISILWLNELLKLRDNILNKKEIITRIKFGKKEIEIDKIRNKLNHLLKRYQIIDSQFKSPVTHLSMVLNCDELSFNEAGRFREKLLSAGFRVDNLIVNKVVDQFNTDNITEKFKESKIIKYRLSEFSLTGYENLKKYLSRYSIEVL